MRINSVQNFGFYGTAKLNKQNQAVNYAKGLMTDTVSFTGAAKTDETVSAEKTNAAKTKAKEVYENAVQIAARAQALKTKAEDLYKNGGIKDGVQIARIRNYGKTIEFQDGADNVKCDFYNLPSWGRETEEPKKAVGHITVESEKGEVERFSFTAEMPMNNDCDLEFYNKKYRDKATGEPVLDSYTFGQMSRMKENKIFQTIYVKSADLGCRPYGEENSIYDECIEFERPDFIVSEDEPHGTFAENVIYF